jgi:hypothetical protein
VCFSHLPCTLRKKKKKPKKKKADAEEVVPGTGVEGLENSVEGQIPSQEPVMESTPVGVASLQRNGNILDDSIETTGGCGDNSEATPITPFTTDSTGKKVSYYLLCACAAGVK